MIEANPAGTDRAFNVNLFAHAPPEGTGTPLSKALTFYGSARLSDGASDHGVGATVTFKTL